MKESDFTKLLKNHQECIFDEKRFRAILNDLFPTDEQMNNILVNLFHLGLPRELEELETVNDTVYYRYKKRVVKTYGIDQKLADEAIRLWMFSYGEGVLKREIKVSAIAPYVEAASEIGWGSNSASGLKEKNFAACTFKVSLPHIVVINGAVKVTFKIISKPSISVDVALNEIYLSDKLNRKYDQYFSGVCKPKESSQKEINVDVEIEGKNLLVSDAVMVLSFLAGDGNRYEVCYKLNAKTGIVLDYVMGRKIGESGRLRLEENVRLVSERKGMITTTEDESEAHPAVKIPKIEEYKKAVLREKFFIQNGGGRKYKVTNGNRIAGRNGLYTYCFEMEAELNLSDDAPITVIVGASESTGSVLLLSLTRTLEPK